MELMCFELYILLDNNSTNSSQGCELVKDCTKLDGDKEACKNYITALHESITELTGDPPDWKPEDLDSNHFLRQFETENQQPS